MILECIIINLFAIVNSTYLYYFVMAEMNFNNPIIILFHLRQRKLPTPFMDVAISWDDNN